MIRVALPGADLHANEIALPADAAHYVVNVRRISLGQTLRLFDGAGHEVDAVLRGGDSGWIVEPVGPVVTGRRAAPVTVCYALAKGDKLDRVARQITELGAARLLLLQTERTVVRLDANRARRRRERLARVMAEAARQCGRADQPALEGPATIEQALDATAEAASRWVLHPEGGRRLDQTDPVAPLALFVGPEGGFSAQEVERLCAAGVVTVTLDCPVLRTETAAPVATALALSRLGVI